MIHLSSGQFARNSLFPPSKTFGVMSDSLKWNTKPQFCLTISVSKLKYIANLQLCKDVCLTTKSPLQ